MVRRRNRFTTLFSILAAAWLSSSSVGQGTQNADTPADPNDSDSRYESFMVDYSGSITVVNASDGLRLVFGSPGDAGTLFVTGVPEFSVPALVDPFGKITSIGAPIDVQDHAWANGSSFMFWQSAPHAVGNWTVFDLLTGQTFGTMSVSSVEEKPLGTGADAAGCSGWEVWFWQDEQLQGPNNTGSSNGEIFAYKDTIGNRLTIGGTDYWNTNTAVFLAFSMQGRTDLGGERWEYGQSLSARAGQHTFTCGETSYQIMAYPQFPEVGIIKGGVSQGWSAVTDGIKAQSGEGGSGKSPSEESAGIILDAADLLLRFVTKNPYAQSIPAALKILNAAQKKDNKDTRYVESYDAEDNLDATKRKQYTYWLDDRSAFYDRNSNPIVHTYGQTIDLQFTGTGCTNETVHGGARLIWYLRESVRDRPVGTWVAFKDKHVDVSICRSGSSAALPDAAGAPYVGTYQCAYLDEAANRFFTPSPICFNT